MSKPIVGAQLYTVREYVKDMPGVKESLAKIVDIGYTAVQISGFGDVTPEDVAAAVKDAGLNIAATHVGWGECLNDLPSVIATHKLWDCRHVAIGGLPGEYHNAEGIGRFIDELEPIADKLAAEGLDFSYHNHNHELARCDGQVWLDTLYKKADPRVLKAEIDTYWIQAGGGDPAAWIRMCAGREPLLHLKDMCVTAAREQRFAEIGEGNLNWRAILEAAEESGVKYLLVEQDNCYERDPFESLAISYRNLKAMGYE